MFWLGFGRYFHGTWWNVSCLACALRVKERKNTFQRKNYTTKTNADLHIPINFDLNRRGSREGHNHYHYQPLHLTNEAKISGSCHSLRTAPWFMTSFARKQYTKAKIGARYSIAVLWLVRDTYPNAAIWLVRDTYPIAAIWLVRATYHSTR